MPDWVVFLHNLSSSGTWAGEAVLESLTGNSLHAVGFLGGSSGNKQTNKQTKPTYQCSNPKKLRFILWVGRIPWRRAWQPTPVFLPRESHGQRGLVGYSPWSRTESDTTQVTQHTSTHLHAVGTPSIWALWDQCCGEQTPTRIFLQPESSSAAFYSLRNVCFHKNDFKTLSIITVNKMGFQTYCWI